MELANTLTAALTEDETSVAEPPIWFKSARAWVLSDEDLIAARRWARTIPPDIRYLVKSFPNHKLTLIEAFVELGQAAIDYIVAGDHALLYVLACANHLGQHPQYKQPQDRRIFTWEGRRELLRMKRADVLKALGMPATPEASELLRRMTFMACQSLQPGRNPPLFDSQAHLIAAELPKINWGVAELLAQSPVREPFWIVTERLIRSLGALENEATAAALVKSLHQTVREVIRAGSFGELKPIDRIEELSARTHDHDRGPRPCGAFQDPPVPALPGIIEPLTCESELVNEGRLMQHCVASSSPAVWSGQMYIYRVLNDELPGMERCTLEIRQRDGQWEIKNIRGWANARVNAATRRFIAEWLSKGGRITSRAEAGTPHGDDRV
ncbi:MAG: PcfJ domain-containing protein [Phycisphaeraceae bacterium]|nr:PcfJ domain-containing protein [Phycisphaeraceae bacterium]